MVTLDWDVERSDGVTLVALFVASDRPCRVRIENRLDGPVWPPRRRGQPTAGWDDGAFTGTVPPDGRLTVGYATPAVPADPPAAVVSTEPVDAAAEQPEESGAVAVAEVAPVVESTPSGVVRALGDPLVPRDCVPVPDGPADAGDGVTSSAASAPASSAADAETSSAADAETSSTPVAAAGGTARAPNPAATAGDDAHGVDAWIEGCRGSERSRNESSDDRSDGPLVDAVATGDRLVIPGPVRTWLRDVDRRLDAHRGRRAGDDGEVSTVSDASAASPLAAAVAADRRALERVRWRVGVLAERARRLDRRRRGRDDGRR